MKLVVDTHHLLLENAGTKRVTVNLLIELKKIPGIALLELQPGYSLHKSNTVFSKLRGHLLRFAWVHIHLPIKCILAKADFLLSPEFNTPMFSPCPRAVIAHDAHMRAQRQYTSSLWFYLYYIPFIELAIRRSNIIFTVSEFAKQQVVSLMKVDDRKVFVTYNGVGNIFFQKKESSPHPLANGLSPQQYILFVGTFEARKNIELLLEAFSVFKKKYASETPDLKLAIVGQQAAGKHSNRNNQIRTLIAHLKLEKQVIICGFVSDEDLPCYYRNARFLVFPSSQEGFGLPVIESFACETPVISSNACSLPEVAGGAALLFDPNNLMELVDKMETLYFDHKLHENLVALGKKQATRFTWMKMAAEVVSILRQNLSKS